ncbi:Plasmodium variant antigen protein Cir/Yir/Bir, putative [Plasmodium chabaudi chabaudi]|uniref:Plasmodium variant antigen protein Cir/Yir/Bir, putative n=1 Tax=Plasmodium chabaudi chabaudi TaxID=31271 RepID=A0A1C6WBL0_PLACU|nr:Plasmodium variant antigen protein Cir/Yir/Bir, putative [Plasmodium chabaudi chabaudi]
MENSSYDIEKVYKEFATIDDYFYVTEDGTFRVNTQHESIDNYCNSGSNSGFGKCNDYLEMTNCSLIYLLKTLKENYALEDDKLAEYAILWLSYKLNKNKKNTFKNLSEFYNSYIETNEHYNKNINGDDSLSYKAIINNKKNLMDMNIKEISKFNDPFSVLFYLYNVFHGERLNCETNLKLAKEFAEYFQEPNKGSNNIENSSYNKLLSTLSNDYNNLKKIYVNENKCSNFQSLPELTPQKNPVGNSGQHTVLSPESTPSSSSILNTVIPVLSTFFVISLFMGVAYKYSLFGFETNEDYNKNINGDGSTYKEIINKIKDLMNTKEISKFNSPFSILFYLYNVFHGERLNCETNLKLAKDFAQYFQEPNNDSNNIENSSYNKLLSTLSNDYNNLKKIYANENKCPNFQSLSKIEPKKNPVGYSGQHTVLSPESTPSRSSILNTVIPVLSTFSVISLFLGVAYKYSLFGFGKRSQKRYLRENIKK